MNLTKKMLSKLGVADEAIAAILDAASKDVDETKAEYETYKADAEKLSAVQTEFDALKAEYEAYKADAEAANSKTVYTVAHPHGLNLRAEPSKQAAILRVLKHGETVTADVEAEPVGGWLAVNGGGYVMTEFLN